MSVKIKCDRLVSILTARTQSLVLNVKMTRRPNLSRPLRRDLMRSDVSLHPAPAPFTHILEWLVSAGLKAAPS